jgi:hypothetical protein
VAAYKNVSLLGAPEAAYIAGLVDGEGTITLSRKHANEQRQLVLTISSTERELLEFVKEAVGAGKITKKATAKDNHAVGLTYALSNRQALSVISQIAPFLRSYKRKRAALVLQSYIRLTPRNGRYSLVIASERRRFEAELLGTRANGQPALASSSRRSASLLSGKSAAAAE